MYFELIASYKKMDSRQGMWLITYCMNRGTDYVTLAALRSGKSYHSQDGLI